MNLKTDAKKIRPSTLFLGLYFVMMAADCFAAGSLGSLLRIFAIIPLLLLVPEFRNLRIKLPVTAIVQLAFWLLTVVSFFYTIDFDCTGKSVVTLSLNLALTICMGTMKSYSARELEYLKKSLVIGSWVTAMLMVALANLYEGRLVLKLGESIQDANYVNGYLLFAFVYHLNSFLKDRKILHILAVMFFTVLILLSGSRGALLAFGMAAFFSLCKYVGGKSGRSGRWIYAIILLVFAIIIFDITLMAMPDHVAERFSWSYIVSPKGTTGRLSIWKNLLGHFSRDNFGRIMFGHGYGTTRLINTYNSFVAHNLYIDSLISTGIVGCLLQIVIQAGFLIIFSKNSEQDMLYVLVGIIGMCLSLSLTSYRPLWNLMTIGLITKNMERDKKPELYLHRCQDYHSIN